MDPVEGHYQQKSILERILDGLRVMGKDPNNLSLEDLAPVDEFHIRGGEATRELANRLEIAPEHRVLDVGCGLGGSARYLASTFGCQVTGIDLTDSFVEVAEALSKLVGLTDYVEFHRASATELPFADGSFDLIWTEHVQMNIADKLKFYSEASRVIRPGGHIMFHDVFGTDASELSYPVPWASEASISHLISPNAVHGLLASLGFQETFWQDCTDQSHRWIRAMLDKSAGKAPPPVGLHILIGPTGRDKLINVNRNIEDGKIQVYQGVFRKA